MSSAVRYCPSCDLAGLAPYTTWMGIEYVDSGVGEQCENDRHDEDADHSTYIESGSYRIICSIINRCDDHGELTIRCKIDGCVCKTLFALLLRAIEMEAVSTIDASKWFKTFPRRTSELVRQHREMAAAVLDDKLPVVLVGIVSAYLW